MAKKKSSAKKGFGLKSLLGIVAAVLGVVALAMMFVKSVKVPDTDLGVLGTKEGSGYTGFQVIFGFTNELDVKTLEFSFMALVPYLLALGGVVVVLINTFKKKGSRLFDYVTICLFVVAGVMFFLLPGFMVFGEYAVISKNAEFGLAVGAIVSAVCSIVAGVAILAKTLLKK